MSVADITPASTPFPYVWMADASVQDNSTKDRQFSGLHNDTSYLWACVDTEAGKRYWLVRTLSPVATYSFSLSECLTDRWTNATRLRSPGRSDMYWGMVVWLDDAGTSTLLPVSEAVAEKHPITVELGPDRFVWKDDGVIDVVMTPLVNNVETIYIPGLPDNVGYTSSGCTVTGTIEGSTVTGGIGGLDRMYVEPGMTSHLCKTAVLEHYWIVWNSLMEDGSWQTGNVWLGEGDFATALLNPPGDAPVIATNGDVTAIVPWETDGETSGPASATLSFGGRTFEWTFTHNAIGGGPSAGVEHLVGSVQEVGGPKPVKSWSVMEVIRLRATPRPAHP